MYLQIELVNHAVDLQLKLQKSKDTIKDIETKIQKLESQLGVDSSEQGRLWETSVCTSYQYFHTDWNFDIFSFSY